MVTEGDVRRGIRLATFSLTLGTAACTPFVDDAAADAMTDGGTHVASGEDESLDSLGADAAHPCDPGMPFGAPILVPGLENVATAVSALRLSRDYGTAYFQASGRSDAFGGDDLYTAWRASSTRPFEGVAPLSGTGIDTPANEYDPTTPGDALTLVFGRAQPGGDPVHLFYASRADTSMPFAGVARLPGTDDLASTSDTGPFFREDGRVLYFASDRVAAQSTDIYRAEWEGFEPDASLGPPNPVDALNTTSSEIDPVVAPDDLTIYFASDRADGNAQGLFDIWIATRASTDGTFSWVTNVVELKSPAFDAPTFVTRDGCTLYFSSTRSGVMLTYVATRRGP
jgi:WD40 repeat protein